MAPTPSEVASPVPISQDEQQESALVQQGIKPKDLKAGQVTLLDGRKLGFQIFKNADGDILFNLVTDAIGLIEKDYFLLTFYDNTGIRKWLYKNKKISKQIADLPWHFSLEVKFYTPDPTQLTDDFTRHLLALQLRTDIYNGKLPASLVNQAHLGALIAQAELGDFSLSKNYSQALRSLNIVPNFNEELESKIIQLYKDQKGKTPPEAELSFLVSCRELTLYGMTIFPAKQHNKQVRIGINSAGISVFQEHLRQNYIVWQSMHQLEYQRKTFTIKLKHGEKEGKSSFSFKLDTEPLAKLCWRTAVEHHTFFRLMQPDEKPNRSGFFQLGSGRFRPEGRTHFQTKMASQMFDGTPTAVPQVSSTRNVTRSTENVSTNGASSPVHYADEKLSEGNSPKKSYTFTHSHVEESNTSAIEQTSGLDEFSKDKANKFVTKQGSSSSSPSDSEVEVEEINVVGHESLALSSEQPATVAGDTNEREAGPYTPANDLDHGPVIRQERVEHVYRITGSGASPVLNPNDPGSTPIHSTLQTWRETESGPEQVFTEVDEQGRTITKTVKTSLEKNTVQKQSYQTFAVEGKSKEPHNAIEPILETIQSTQDHVLSGAKPSHARTRVLVYGKDGVLQTSEEPSTYEENQIVSSKVVTTGNRTIETITYKTVKDGVTSTNVEHRVTIQGPEVDHEAELRKAIIEATGLNPNYEVQRVQVKQERLA